MTLSRDDFEYIRDLVSRRAGIQLDFEKAYRVESSLLPLAKSESCDSLSAFISQLRQSTSSPQHRRVIEAMTINETTFFRDVYPFDALRQEIIPRLLAGGAKTVPGLKIWCAACATGQEPYSVAMLLRESFPLLKGEILATDLSERVLEQARSGRYSPLEINRGLPTPMLLKYFQRAGLSWQLTDAVRRAVEFRPLNLIDAWPVQGPFDVIFLRNVLIYFSTNTRRAILTRIARVLKPGGALFLGGAETTLQLSDAFERVTFQGHAYYRLLPATVQQSAIPVSPIPQYALGGHE